MRGTILYGTGDVRFEDVATPKITEPTDAVIRLAATCVCGSDLWSYRGISPVEQPTPMGHEYCGVVEEVGSAVQSVKPGQFVIGSFFASDSTCPHCNFGYQTEARRAMQVGNDFGAVSSGLVQNTTDLLFRELWPRPALAPRDRSLVTVSALIAGDQVAQVTYHLNRAMDNGLTQEQASEILTHIAFYSGWPCAFSALPVVKAVFEKRPK
jgi:alkylhydroperoxidase/carboxymuconolactone decarboxylase family protein YurZ